jgi:hypothetical protein
MLIVKLHGQQDRFDEYLARPDIDCGDNPIHFLEYWFNILDYEDVLSG